MHPVENIRGTASHHLAGRKVVLGVCGSIAAVKTVELARELVRHGADVVTVMSDGATRILHPDALHFATGNPVVTRLGGEVEHVSLLGNVKGRADLLLIAPATANTLSKVALGIDDTPVTTCATVALGNKVPILVAPAMHEVMLDHPVVAQHVATLKRLGVHWIEPDREENKAKLADIESIAEEVIHILANHGQPKGPLAGKRALVVSGSTAEPVDDVRTLSNRSSGLSGILIATELRRLGAEVTLWQGHATVPVPPLLAATMVPFSSHASLLALARSAKLDGFDQVWMPAAIGDYAPPPVKGKIASGQDGLQLRLHPLPKVIATVRKRAPKAVLVAFKAESDPKRLLGQARDRLATADFVVANPSASFGAEDTTAHLVDAQHERTFTGRKATVMRNLVEAVAAARPPPKADRRKSSRPVQRRAKA